MFKLESNNQLIYRTFHNLLNQKNIINQNIQNENTPILVIKDSDEKITILFNDFKKNYLKPINLNFLITDLTKVISRINYKLGNKLYFPYLRKICDDQKKIFLSDIQNNILFCLIENQQGLNKDKLYNLIWSKDKNILINKLDTHLTNLKNLLFEELDFKINFTSSDKNLKLVIN